MLNKIKFKYILPLKVLATKKRLFRVIRGHQGLLRLNMATKPNVSGFFGYFSLMGCSG